MILTTDYPARSRIVRLHWDHLLRSLTRIALPKERPVKIIQNRRTFMAGLSAAGGMGLFEVRKSNAAEEPPPETTSVRLPRYIDDNAPCWASRLPRRRTAARRRLHRCPLRARRHQCRQYRVARRRRDRFRYQHAVDAHPDNRGRRTDQSADRCALRVLRADGQ